MYIVARTGVLQRFSSDNNKGLISCGGVIIRVIDMQLRCKDVGVDCDFEIKGASSEEEIMQMASIHAKLAHNMDLIPPELAAKAKAAIKK